MIQKHAASHLHYDWRLEMQGVLRSWAVPKGPPTQLREARLAMHVEDHPLEYEKFEGTIPPGNYGAGHRDGVGLRRLRRHHRQRARLRFTPGKMHIVMQGQKLKGEWILVKDKREPESNKWLLIKAGESMRRSRPKWTTLPRSRGAPWRRSRKPTMRNGKAIGRRRSAKAVRAFRDESG